MPREFQSQIGTASVHRNSPARAVQLCSSSDSPSPVSSLPISSSADELNPTKPPLICSLPLSVVDAGNKPRPRRASYVAATEVHRRLQPGPPPSSHNISPPLGVFNLPRGAVLSTPHGPLFNLSLTTLT
ncbi:hypothetical protein M0R45_026339 [Rubus argutus]|uniref:Uncharacterized protein n=1 Tax=Rubus argutus TaxID=59490 RepID=A0AAW1WZV2_RUBAR